MNILPGVLPRKKRLPLGEEEASDLAQRLSAIADPTRLQIIGILNKDEGQVCVFELVHHFDLAQPTISHHLKILVGAGLIFSRRRGLYQYYFLRRNALSQILADMQALAPNLLS